MFFCYQRSWQWSFLRYISCWDLQCGRAAAAAAAFVLCLCGLPEGSRGLLCEARALSDLAELVWLSSSAAAAILDLKSESRAYSFFVFFWGGGGMFLRAAPIY